MKLYHFCAGKDFQAIRKEGLTKGVILTLKDSKPRFYTCIQWLTKNGSFDQSWDCGLHIDSRTDYRITVRIKDGDPRLKNWLAFCGSDQGKEMLGEETIEILNCLGTPGNWVVYFGEISPKRFRGFVREPVWKEVE